MSTLSSVSPIDGRYHRLTSSLSDYFSEYTLIKYRLLVEVRYLLFLSQQGIIPPISVQKKIYLMRIVEKFTLKDAKKIKSIEHKIHHDVKSIEYFLKTQLSSLKLNAYIPFIHIGLTSEDINSVSYRLMIKKALSSVMLPAYNTLLDVLTSFISTHKKTPMLARTHGQPAVPTLLGKEFSVYKDRLSRQIMKLKKIRLRAKFGGAVGNMSALNYIYPNIDWIKASKDFLKEFNLKKALATTQIAPPEDIIEVMHTMFRANAIIIDMNQDIWRYISDGWFVQKGKKRFVGSSTMPQKINPIEFENSEGNLTMANGVFETLSRKLPISRLQRDLSDSTVMRNVGTGFAYTLLGVKNCHRGFLSLAVDKKMMEKSLISNWSILSEAVQVYLRKIGKKDAYEKIAKHLRGVSLSQSQWKKLISSLDITPEEKKKLLMLTHKKYTGCALKITDIVLKRGEKNV